MNHLSCTRVLITDDGSLATTEVCWAWRFDPRPEVRCVHYKFREMTDPVGDVVGGGARFVAGMLQQTLSCRLLVAPLEAPRTVRDLWLVETAWHFERAGPQLRARSIE